jgi:hypothetical protein
MQGYFPMGHLSAFRIRTGLALIVDEGQNAVIYLAVPLLGRGG